MASASIYIQKESYGDGTVPIFIRIIVNRKIHLRQICKVPDDFIDRRKKEIRAKHPDHNKLNYIIWRELNAARDYLLDCQFKKIEPDPEKYFIGINKGVNLGECILNRAAEFEALGKYATAAKIRATGGKVLRLHLDVPVSDITLAWIKKLDKKLIEEGNNPNTRAKDMAIISAVLNQVEGAANPFTNYRKPSNRTTKAKLSAEELKMLQEVELTGPEDMVRLMFIFAVMARGIRAYDLLTLKWSDIRDDRLVYVASKTGKLNDIKITEAMGGILDKFFETRGKSIPYIFPFLRTSPDMALRDKKRFLGRVNRAAWRVNAVLKNIAAKAGIPKNITLHVARHTFAYLADQGGVPLGTIQQLLDHGKIGTTAAYVESLRRADELDDAVDGLFG